VPETAQAAQLRDESERAPKP
jgi:hypothetical protein